MIAPSTQADLCVWNPPVTVHSPNKGPVVQTFDIFFDVNLEQAVEQIWELRLHCNTGSLRGSGNRRGKVTLKDIGKIDLCQTITKHQKHKWCDKLLGYTKYIPDGHHFIFHVVPLESGHMSLKPIKLTTTRLFIHQIVQVHQKSLLPICEGNHW